MGFKLTYRDGQEDDYDDATKWDVEGGVLKMGREADNWTVLVSPSHWATIEVHEDRDEDDDQDDDDQDTDDSDDGENGENDT